MTCKRCWGCCIKALYLPQFKLEEIHERMAGLDMLQLDTALHICPVLGVNSKGQPECYIYKFRPKTCRRYKCSKAKFNARVAAKFTRFRKRLLASTATVTYGANTAVNRATVT